jgi:hypothetical protein
VSLLKIVRNISAVRDDTSVMMPASGSVLEVHFEKASPEDAIAKPIFISPRPTTWN